MKKAIALVSGGMDSLVTLAIAMKEFTVYPLHVNYKNKTDKKELDCFNNIKAFYRLKNFLTVDLDYLAKIGGSSLTDSNIQPEEGMPKENEIPSSYVPFRNTHLLSIAVSWAEVIEASAIFIGAVQQDSSGYPDCRARYIESFNRLIETGSKIGKRLTVKAPLINMSKKEIVKMGAELKVPFEMTWSCYSTNDKACGKCHSCNLRLKAFREAGVEDPIEYNPRGAQ